MPRTGTKLKQFFSARLSMALSLCLRTKLMIEFRFCILLKVEENHSVKFQSDLAALKQMRQVP